VTPENDASSATPRPLRRYSQRTQWLLLGLGVPVLVALFVFVRLAAHFIARAPEPVAAQTAPGTFRPSKDQWASLKLTEVKTQTFATQVVADGSIAYNDDTTTPVFSPYSGRVTKLIAKPGDIVKQGAPLMAVEATEFAQGQSDLGTAHAQLALAQANEQRQHALYEEKAGALKDWLQAQADLTAAQNTLTAARNRLHILGKSDTEIAALEASAQKPAQNAEAFVLAPIAGTVTQRQVGLGQYIATGAATPAYAIGNLSSVWLIANVRETDAPQMRVGEAIDVHVLAYPERTFSARITWVAPSIDPPTRRLAVRAQLDNRDGLLKPQMFASFAIRAGDETASPAVPKSAVVYEGEDARVYVARDDGTIALRPIRVGRSDGDLIEVLSGLAAGEKVVSAGTLFIDRATDSGA
jgi:cobalt-zinc-cadmium efflux system membrane fusion protein